MLTRDLRGAAEGGAVERRPGVGRWGVVRAPPHGATPQLLQLTKSL